VAAVGLGQGRFLEPGDAHHNAASLAFWRSPMAPGSSEPVMAVDDGAQISAVPEYPCLGHNPR